MSVSYDGVLSAMGNTLMPCCRTMDREVLRGRILANKGYIMLASAGDMPECRIFYCPFCGALDENVAKAEMKQ